MTTKGLGIGIGLGIGLGVGLESAKVEKYLAKCFYKGTTMVGVCKYLNTLDISYDQGRIMAYWGH
jgi:hypothetical protein